MLKLPTVLSLRDRLNSCPAYSYTAEDWIAAALNVYHVWENDLDVTQELVDEVETVWQKYASNLMEN